LKTRSTKEKNSDEMIARFRKVLSGKMVLANILKECTDEFSSFDVRYIFESCIEGSAEIAEIFSPEETEPGTVYQKPFYDLRFYASVPQTGEFIKFIIKIDLSGKRRTHEYRARKGMYYAARMIATQDDPEDGVSFDDSVKAYTIWICPDDTGKLPDSAVCYGSSQKVISGKAPGKTDAGTMKVVTICLDRTVQPSLKESSVTDLLKLIMNEEPDESEINALYELYNIRKENLFR